MFVTVLPPLTSTMAPPASSTALPILETVTPITSTSTSTTPHPPAETFFKLCLLWSALHQSNAVPKVCRTVLPQVGSETLRSRVDLNKVLRSLGASGRDHSSLRSAIKADNKGDEEGGHNHIRFHYRYTSRSLSAIGVLGGIVLILLIVALSTCIRNRRGFLEEQQQPDTFARQILIDHIRHLSNSRADAGAVGAVGAGANAVAALRRDTPPAYDEVVKSTEQEQQSGEDEFQPPSYIEAVEAEPEAASSALREVARPPPPHVVTIEVIGDSRRPQESEL